MEHFEGALRDQRLTPSWRQKIQEWEERAHENGATVVDVADLEKMLKKAIILRDIAGADIYKSGKYRSGGADMEVICHNDNAWSDDLHTPDQGGPHLRGRRLACGPERS